MPIEQFLSAAEMAAVRQPLPQASYLPPRLYHDADFYAFEIEKVFMRQWLPVGHVSELPQPGSYVARDMFNEPLVITRDSAGQIQVLSNVCRHRTAKVVTGSGRFNADSQTINCPYHGWGYAADGALMAAPMMHKTEGFERHRIGLPRIRTEVWQGFIFANFDHEATALGPQLETLSKVLAPFQMDQLVVSEFARYGVNWNWKVSLENFTEGYHQMAVHANSIEPYIPARLQTYDDVDGPYNLFWMPSLNRRPLFEQLMPPMAGLPAEYHEKVIVVNVFPLFHLLIDAGMVLWLDWEPRGVVDHDLRWRLLVTPEAAAEPDFEARKLGLVSLMKAVWAEDNSSCDGVNLGVRSRLATVGRPCFMEKSVLQFQQWLTDCYSR